MRSPVGADIVEPPHNIILATGSDPLKLPNFPFDGKTVITSDEALNLDQAPKSMLVVGGGYIGVEWASVFQQFGAKVTVVEMMDARSR